MVLLSKKCLLSQFFDILMSISQINEPLLYMGVAYYCLNQSQAYISSLQPLSMGQ